jgi:hypothetical protein
LPQTHDSYRHTVSVEELTTAAFRECWHLDELIFQLQTLMVVDEPFPEKEDLSRVFRGLSLLKCLFRDSSTYAKKNGILAVYLYLLSYTRLTIPMLQSMEPLSVDISTLQKYSKSLAKKIESLDWPDFLRRHSDAKIEMLACVFAYQGDSISGNTGNTSRGDSVLSILSPAHLKNLDPVVEFCKAVGKARQNNSKLSKQTA